MRFSVFLRPIRCGMSVRQTFSVRARRVSVLRVGLVMAACVLVRIEVCAAQVSPAQTVSDSVTRALGSEAVERFRAEGFALRVVGRSPGDLGSFRTSEEGAEWRRWLPYRGGRELSEEAFFRAAGEYRLANEADSYRATNLQLIVSGGISVLLGAGAIYGGRAIDFGSSLQIAGASLGGLGVVIGVAGVLRNRKRHAPFRVAYDVARARNEELIREVRSSR